MNHVELHFIDGPLQGTRQVIRESEVSRNRTYRYLEPIRSYPEQKVPNSNSAIDFVQVVCAEWTYMFVPIPPAYFGHGVKRFAMVLERPQ